MSAAVIELPDLVGRELSAVVFVRDYLQLQFDGSTANLIAWPVVHAEGRSWTFADPGYRDALCALIGKAVEAADVIEGDRFRIAFRGASVLSVSLKDEDRRYPDTLVFNQEDGGWWAW